MKDILIVEDGRQEQLRLLRLAEESQFRAKAVSSVEDAGQELANERYRLIILDLGLEDQSGLHLFRQLQELPQMPKVLVLTGNPSTHLKQRFLDAGAVAYIYKGSETASNESLSEILRTVLSSETASPSIEYRELSLNEFLRDFVTPESRALFHPHGSEDLRCIDCDSTSFIVTFSHKTQLPPLIEGKVCCAACGALLDPELG